MQFRSTLRHILGLTLVLSLLLGSAGTVLAQTPDATPETTGNAPAIGDAVVFPDTNGNEIAQIAVNQVIDPYEDAEDADRGFHWLAVEFIIANTGDAEFEVDTYRLQVIDEQGFVASTNYAPREDDVDASQPELLNDPVPAGETVSGWLFYQVYNDATPVQIGFVEPYGGGRFVVLANLGDTVPAEGAGTTIFDSNLDELGLITVDEVLVDMQNDDSEIEVGRGTTVVGVNVTVENTGESDLEPDTYSFLAVDELGVTYSPSFVSRSEDSEAEFPELTSDPIPAGESVTGILLYEFPSDATLNYFLYVPDTSILYVISQVGEGSVVSGETLEPVAGEPVDDSTDDTASGGEETGDCVGVAQWVDDANALVVPLVEALGFLDQDLADVNTDDLRAGADSIDDVLTAAEDMDVPAVAQTSHDSLIAMLEVFQTAFNDIADRLDDGETVENIQAELGAPDGELVTAITNATTASAELEELCPDSNVADLGL